MATAPRDDLSTIIAYLRRKRASPTGIASSLHPIHHAILTKIIDDLQDRKHLE